LQHLTLDALVAATLAELRTETADTPVPHLVELHRRGTRDVFERALALTESRDVAERVLGVRILRELGGSPPRFAAEAIPALLSMLANEKSPDVVRWIISAIGYQRVPDARVLSAAVSHASHDDARVRFAVAAALPGLVDVGQPESIAIDALVRLSSDEDADVRYYALAALTDELHLASNGAVTRALERASQDSDEQIQRAARRVLNAGAWAEPA
jgi:hypothetical protein